MKVRTASGDFVEYHEEAFFDADDYITVDKDAPGPLVIQVWEFWLETLRSNSKVRCVMSDKRRRKIEQGLANYTVDDLKDAIRGCAQSDFHMGRNGRGKKYDDIELILRDPEHIERFITDYREAKPDF